jgi:hypothetical protein
MTNRRWGSGRFGVSHKWFGEARRFSSALI